MKKLMSMIGVVALLFGTSFAQDSATPETMQRGKQGKYQAMLNEIPDLTDDQKAQIKEIHQAARKQLEPQREETKKLRMKMMELKSADNPDQKQINELIDRQAKVKAEMMKSRTASELKIRGILTPEQRKAFDAKQKERREVREKKMMEKKEMRHGN